MEWLAFAGSAVTALAALLGTYFANKKQTALMAYRLEQLEKKMEQLEGKVGQHNNFEGRLIAIETRMNDLHSA